MATAVLTRTETRTETETLESSESTPVEPIDYFASEGRVLGESSQRYVKENGSGNPGDRFRAGLQPRLNDVFIAVMGMTGVGKSTFISLLTSSRVEIGHGLESCWYPVFVFELESLAFGVILTQVDLGTAEVGVYVYKYSKDINIYLVDTPGFDDGNGRSNMEILLEIATWPKDSYTSDIKLNGIIYLHRITDRRMQGSAYKNLSMFKQLCGPQALKSVILATSMWESIDNEDGVRRETELVKNPNYWGNMCREGSQVFRHKNTIFSAEKIVHQLAFNRPTVTLGVQQQMVHDGKSLNETSAGQVVQEDIAKERAKFEAKLAQHRKETEEILKRKDLVAKHEAQMRDAKLKKEMQRLDQKSKLLAASLKSTRGI